MKLRGRFASGSHDRVRAARDFLRGRAGLFGIPGDLAGLHLTGRSDDVGGTVVRFGQRHLGVPVEDGSVIVGFAPDGHIIHVDSSYVPALALPASPPLPASRAARKAESAVGAPAGQARGARLVITAGDKGTPGHHLAWEVPVSTVHPRGEWRVYVDSISGTVVRRLDLIRRAGPPCVPAEPSITGDAALVFPLSPADALGDATLTDASDVDAAQRGCKLHNLTSTTALTGRYVNTSLTPAPRATPPYTARRSTNQAAVNEANAYYHVNRSKEYLNHLGFPGVMDHSIAVNASGTSWDNSFYDGDSKSLEFGTGGVDDAQDPDVVAHEVMHAIIDDQVPGFGGSPEGGAIHEGGSDYWAAALTDDGTKHGAACIAAWNAAGAGWGNCMRRIDGVKQYPRDLTFEGHDDGEIYSAALWKLRAAVGAETADRLVIKSHSLLQRRSGFLGAADALLSADAALSSGAHAAAIESAMSAHGIPRTATPASTDDLTSVRDVNCAAGHPYYSGDFAECRFVVPGAARLQVRFSSFETEQDYDLVLVSDGAYRQVQALSGTPFASPDTALSAAVSGDTIVVRFKADSSTDGHGFAIDQVRYAKSTPSLTWSRPDAIPYGTALSSTQLNASASVPGSFTYTPPAGTVLDAGEDQALKVDFAPADQAGYNPTSETVLIDVVKADQAIAFTLPGTATFGDAPIQLTATASSELPVSYAATGACSVTGTTLSFTGSGTCAVEARQSGDRNHNPAPAVVQTVDIARAPTTITWRQPNEITYGTPLSAAQLNATGSVQGTLRYTPPAGTILDVGWNELRVTLTPADANYAPATATVDLLVRKAATELSDLRVVRPGPRGSVGGLSATLSRVDDGKPIPGRIVQFTSAMAWICDATTNSSGVAQCPFTLATTLQAINSGFEARYFGELNYMSSSARTSLLGPGGGPDPEYE